jgi:hypothetical protein
LNLTDRIYVAVHVALTVLVCARFQCVERWPLYMGWNLCAMAAILLLARKRRGGTAWEFAHNWLPAFFFITVFQEVSYLSLSLRSGWNDPYVFLADGLLFNGPPAVWMHAHAATWLVQFLEFGYFAFYPLYPVVGGLFWMWRERQPFTNAFRRLTDALSVGYLIVTQPICSSRRAARQTISECNNSLAGKKVCSRAWCGLFKTTPACTGTRSPARTSCWRSSSWCSPTDFCRVSHRGCCSRFC